jgi:pimeloyl-ACP methyl ester carboxylesterase
MNPMIRAMLCAGVLMAFAGSTTLAGPSTLAVGSLILKSCRAGHAYCGVLDRPLDPEGSVAGRIPVYFEFYLHRGAHPARGTLVATEGGPGYPATESRGDYLALFEPLRADHDVILMDNRGTGRSGAIDCPELQTAPAWTIESIGRCGALLGERAPFYGSAYAADDLAAVLDALQVARIDLYGDSYGTYFEQVFALRHPARLHSLVLDGAYPLDGPDYAWYPNYAPAMRDKFNLACRRSPACAALPGSSIEHILPVLQQLRARPDAPAAAARLAIVMFGGAPARASVRELDAAARAYLAQDPVPLERLMRETALAVDSRDPTSDPTQWSAGLAAAVMCHDPPQIYDMHLAPGPRAADRDRALAMRRLNAPDTYAPFTIDEYRGMPLDYSFLDQCVAWPGRAGEPLNGAFADIPALVISGEFDNMTTAADGAAVANEFRHARHVVIANALHVNALPRGRSGCAALLVRRFLRTGSAGDAACAGQAPPLRLLSRFARDSAELEPASARAGADTTQQLQVIAAAVLTLGDVWARAGDDWAHDVAGLRGGQFSIHAVDGRLRINLDGLRWTEDVTLNGTTERPLARGGATVARVEVSGPDGISGRLHIRWIEDQPEAGVHIDGRLSGAGISATAGVP